MEDRWEELGAGGVLRLDEWAAARRTGCFAPQNRDTDRASNYRGFL